jgi:hypothetical protein
MAEQFTDRKLTPDEINNLEATKRYLEGSTTKIEATGNTHPAVQAILTRERAMIATITKRIAENDKYPDQTPPAPPKPDTEPGKTAAPPPATIIPGTQGTSGTTINFNPIITINMVEPGAQGGKGYSYKVEPGGANSGSSSGTGGPGQGGAGGQGPDAAGADRGQGPKAEEPLPPLLPETDPNARRINYLWRLYERFAGDKKDTTPANRIVTALNRVHSSENLLEVPKNPDSPEGFSEYLKSLDYSVEDVPDYAIEQRLCTLEREGYGIDQNDEIRPKEMINLLAFFERCKILDPNTVCPARDMVNVLMQQSAVAERLLRTHGVNNKKGLLEIVKGIWVKRDARRLSAEIERIFKNEVPWAENSDGSVETAKNIIPRREALRLINEKLIQLRRSFSTRSSFQSQTGEVFDEQKGVRPDRYEVPLYAPSKDRDALFKSTLQEISMPIALRTDAQHQQRWHIVGKALDEFQKGDVLDDARLRLIHFNLDSLCELAAPERTVNLLHEAITKLHCDATGNPEEIKLSGIIYDPADPKKIPHASISAAPISTNEFLIHAEKIYLLSLSEFSGKQQRKFEDFQLI